MRAGDTEKGVVPFRIEHPERIPAERYYDPGFFARERESLWPRVWQMACRVEEIPEVGDWIEYQILEKSVVVVRTASGIKAFQNACRHRGMLLASGQGNCKTQGFICPFHGWRWNMDGENTFVFGRSIFSEDNLEKAELDLVACRVELWGGCVFINFDGDAPPLRDCIKPAADRLDPRNADDLKVEWWTSTVLPANWKLAMEAFMESYHVMRTHPQLHATPFADPDRFGPDGSGSGHRFGGSRDYVAGVLHHLELLSEGMGGMIHAMDIAVAREVIDEIDFPEDKGAATAMFFDTVNREITSRARARGIPMPDLQELSRNHPAPAVQFIFPNYFLLPQFGNMAAYRIRPLTEESCLFELWSLILYPEGERREPPQAPVPMPFDCPEFPEIPRQDYANLPFQQRGLHAPGFRYMRLSREKEGVISNYQRVIDSFLGGSASREALVTGMQIACGALDEPIADLDALAS